MKKIAIILSVVVAFVATSCVKPYEEHSNSLDNFEVNIPKSVSDTADPIHYIHITASGSWTAVLSTQNGNAWCWLEEAYINPQGEPVKVVTGVDTFDDMEGRYKKVTSSGTVYLPLHYTTTATNRYATLVVTFGSGKQEIMRITQK